MVSLYIVRSAYFLCVSCHFCFLIFFFCFFLMIRRPPRSTRTDHSFPTRRSSDLDEHSDDHLPAGLKPLHRIGDMAAAALFGAREDAVAQDRKSTRLNSSH